MGITLALNGDWMTRDRSMTGWVQAHWSRLAAGTAILAVAAVAGVISYSHIYEETVRLHQTVMVARLMPFAVDGLVTIGAVVLLQAAPSERWLGWLGVGPGVAISLFANVESGIRYGWLAATWAGIPAVSFALATFVLEHWLASQAKSKKAPGTALADATGIAPAPAPVHAAIAAPDDASETATVTAPVPAPVRAHVTAPEGEPGRAGGATETANQKAPRKAETTPRLRRVQGRPNDLEHRAKRILAHRPDITGADLGRALGVSPRTGQKLLKSLKTDQRAKVVQEAAPEAA